MKPRTPLAQQNDLKSNSSSKIAYKLFYSYIHHKVTWNLDYVINVAKLLVSSFLYLNASRHFVADKSTQNRQGYKTV